MRKYLLNLSLGLGIAGFCLTTFFLLAFVLFEFDLSSFAVWLYGTSIAFYFIGGVIALCVLVYDVIIRKVKS